MFFKEIKSSVWWNASVWAIVLNNRIKVNGDLSIFDQMLEIGVATILADHSFTNKVLFQSLKLLFV